MKRIKYSKYQFPKDTASTQITEARFYGNVPGHLRSTKNGLTTVCCFQVSICSSVLLLPFFSFKTMIKFSPFRIANGYHCVYSNFLHPNENLGGKNLTKFKKRKIDE